MLRTAMFSPRRENAGAALGWEIRLSIWAFSIAVAVFAVLGDLRPSIFNEVLG